MKFLDDAFHDLITNALAENNLMYISQENLDNLASDVCKQVSGDVSTLMIDAILKNASKALRSTRKLEKGFVKRNTKRWAKALDLLETCIHINHEIGDLFVQESHDDIFDVTPHKIQVLTLLQVRALLVSRESLSLIKNGYADGALARWRSLHELSVVAQFIKEHDDIIAERYLLSFDMRALRAMKQYQEHHEQAGLHPYEDDEIAEKEKDCRQIESEYGKEMKFEYGWAVPALKNISKPTFYDLEKYVELEHMRPYYAWASHTLHAGFKPPNTFLGSCEMPFDPEEPVLLAGPSNSGLTDPIGLIAISLQQVTSSLLLLKECWSSIVSIKIIIGISNQLHDTLKHIEEFEDF